MLTSPSVPPTAVDMRLSLCPWAGTHLQNSELEFTPSSYRVVSKSSEEENVLVNVFRMLLLGAYQHCCLPQDTGNQVAGMAFSGPGTEDGKLQ